MFHRGEWDTAGCILVYLHLPGYWIADTFKQLPLPGIAFLIFICFIGFVQWLLIYFVGLTIWSKIRNHEKTAA